MTVLLTDTFSVMCTQYGANKIAVVLDSVVIQVKTWGWHHLKHLAVKANAWIGPGHFLQHRFHCVVHCQWCKWQILNTHCFLQGRLVFNYLMVWRQKVRLKRLLLYFTASYPRKHPAKWMQGEAHDSQRCAVQLYCWNVVSHCTVQLYCWTVASHCTVQLYCWTVVSNCTVKL